MGEKCRIFPPVAINQRSATGLLRMWKYNVPLKSVNNSSKGIIFKKNFNDFVLVCIHPYYPAGAVTLGTLLLNANMYLLPSLSQMVPSI